MVLVHKWPFFQLFCLGNIGQENILYDILERKNAFPGYKNKNFKKSKNCNFSKGVNPWFWSKYGHFFNLFFQGIQVWKMSFTIFQNEKTPFQAIKTRISKSPKIVIFRKGLTLCFCPNMAIFQTFFFQAIYVWKMSSTIFYNEKTPFLGIKTRSSIPRKIEIFPSVLTHGFGPKMAIFPTFVFRQYSRGKYPLLYSRTKKRLSRL